MMINNFILNVKSETPSDNFTMSNSRSQLFQNVASKTYEVLDLSRRRDSVETRKTPSPYNSSSFEEGSPSTIHDSPHRASSTSNGPINSRSETPLHHFSSPSTTTFNHRYSPPNYPLAYPNTTNTPPKDHKMFLKHMQPDATECRNPYMLQGQLNGQHHRESMSPGGENHFYARPLPTPDDRISPYMIQAAALQQQLAQNPSVELEDTPEANQYKSSASYSSNMYPMVIGRDGKLTRPFKAYPRDPLSITASFTASDALMDTQSAEKYQIFRKEMLKQIRAANGGQPTLSNPKMRRTSLKSSETSSQDGDASNDTNNNTAHSGGTIDSINNPLGGVKDTAYYERRKKNNAAAKKSRDRRRIKEDEIAIRANFLERENIELKFELAAARKQLALYGVKT